MNFYELSKPDYKSDQADNAANPLTECEKTVMPGLICSACGSTWAGNRRLYLPVHKVSLRQRLVSGPLQAEEWQELAEAVHTELNLPAEFTLRPGDRLGTPCYELTKAKLHDFLHPFPGTILIKKSVLEIIENADLTGFAAVQVKVRWGSRVKNPAVKLPELYVLRIWGSAWHPGITLKNTTICTICGRFKPPTLDWHFPDENTWDQSDFLHLDANPNRVVVTERVCKILSEHNFTNWICD